jgi:hypothetical protein
LAILRRRSFKMKKNAIILGLLIVAMGLGFSGCATMTKNTPADQKVKLYLEGDKSYLEQVGDFKPRKFTTIWVAGSKDQDKRERLTYEIPAGEYKVVVSAPRNLLPGRKKWDTTFNFEAGKRYLLQIRTDPSLSIAEDAAARLRGDYMLVITDKDAPSNRKTIEINIDLSGGR